MPGVVNGAETRQRNPFPRLPAPAPRLSAGTALASLRTNAGLALFEEYVATVGARAWRF